MPKIICSEIDCTGCGACVQACPKKCIKLIENKEGFYYPSIDMEYCIECGKCQKVCHINNEVSKYNSSFYMCWNQSKEVLKNSSSGGAFTAIAKCIFDRNGVVFGAYQDFASRNVYHMEINSYDELDKIRLSKYCQSSINDTYMRIKGLLCSDTPTLFCGTACQIAGLLCYLKNTAADKKRDLLYTVDVLCHGVASQKTVNAFLKCKEEKFGKKIDKYFFRVKMVDKGWKSGSGKKMRLIFDDGTEYMAPHSNKDTYSKGYNKSIFLRESCYRCRYCGTDRISDFTIADYWGVSEDSVPTGQLQYGVSLMLINTEKARQLYSELELTMHIESIIPDTAVAHNLAFTRPQTRPPERDRFFQMLEKYSYDTVIFKLFRKDFIKADIKQMVNKIVGDKLYSKLLGKCKNAIKRK